MADTTSSPGSPRSSDTDSVAEFAGSPAPDFTLVDIGLDTKALADFVGKVKLLIALPSLDTGVCDIEAKRFNAEAAALGNDVAVLVISMDLPFAQKRWCGVNDAANIVTLSDYRDRSFGANYGVLIKELKLLARSIFVVDKQDKVSYVQIVPEMSQEPNYTKALEAVKAVA